MPYIVNSQNIRIRQHLAGIGSRAVALLADGVLLFVYYFGFAQIIKHAKLSSFVSDWIIVFLFILPVMLYQPLCELFFNGQTFGKRLMNIRVVRLDGEALTIGNCLLRYFLLMVDCLSGMVLGVVLIALTPRSQRLGDLAAGTTVVSDRAFKHSRVDLSEYDFVLKDYKPRYLRAAELTQKQADIIEHALESKGKKRKERLEKLCAKVETICGKNEEAGAGSAHYLAQVLRDYRYFAIQPAG